MTSRHCRRARLAPTPRIKMTRSPLLQRQPATARSSVSSTTRFPNLRKKLKMLLVRRHNTLLETQAIDAYNHAHHYKAAVATDKLKSYTKASPVRLDRLSPIFWGLMMTQRPSFVRSCLDSLFAALFGKNIWTMVFAMPWQARLVIVELICFFRTPWLWHFKCIHLCCVRIRIWLFLSSSQCFLILAQVTTCLRDGRARLLKIQ